LTTCADSLARPSPWGARSRAWDAASGDRSSGMIRACRCGCCIWSSRRCSDWSCRGSQVRHQGHRAPRAAPRGRCLVPH